MRASASEPTSAQVTSGVVLKPSRRTDGCTFPIAAWKSAWLMASPASCGGVSGAVASHGSSSCIALSLAAPPTAGSAVGGVASAAARAEAGGAPPRASRPSKMRFTALAAASLHSDERSAPT